MSNLTCLRGQEPWGPPGAQRPRAGRGRAVLPPAYREPKSEAWVIHARKGSRVRDRARSRAGGLRGSLQPQVLQTHVLPRGHPLLLVAEVQAKASVGLLKGAQLDGSKRVLTLWFSLAYLCVCMHMCRGACTRVSTHMCSCIHTCGCVCMPAGVSTCGCMHMCSICTRVHLVCRTPGTLCESQST